jgi:hypothetical protein
VTGARPDPEALLARAKEEEARKSRGRLKLFFGAAAGVGKTFAMLEAARELKADGVDVVIGYVETHGRAETGALLEGLEHNLIRQFPPIVTQSNIELRTLILWSNPAAALSAPHPCVLTCALSLEHRSVIDAPGAGRP